MGFLQEIAQLTASRLVEQKKAMPLSRLEDQPLFHRTPHNVLQPFRRDGYNIISEIKFASPSEGVIHVGGDPLTIAKDYKNAGATMLSVLTEPDYFRGCLDYLRKIREQDDGILLLRKDFIVDPYQLVEARACGADAVLLIVAMTGDALTQELFTEARALGLTPLVEVHSEEDMAIALEMGADFVGVNNRNLETLVTDLNIGRELAARKPKDAVFICESGLSTAADLKGMRALGYDGFLMGTSFMRHKDPGGALERLMGDLSCA
jgi:indole-3-glycerol phosphate synthase